MIKNKKFLLSLFFLMVSAVELNATILERTGWNLISICQDINRSDLNMSNIQELQNQDGLSIYTGEFSSFSNLFSLKAGYAYWVKGTIGSEFNSGERNRTLQQPLLRNQWNLMGSCQNQTTSDIDMTFLSEIQSQNGESLYTKENASLSNLDTLRNGYGYWIKGDKGTLFYSYLYQEPIDTEAPLLPIIINPPTRTTQDRISIELQGEAQSTVLVNNIKVGTIDTTGTATFELNTSGENGNKNFTIQLRDSAGNDSETLNIMIERISITRANALKFLRQASFRTNEAEISYIMTNGYEAWIDNQFSMVGDLDSRTDTKYGYLESTLRTMNRYRPEYPLSVALNPTTLDEGVIDGQRMDVFRNSVFWDKALNDENQLRQRVTYALSQILVVADISPVGKALYFRGESVINYYDTLYKHSFGNYRNLLTDVTHSSAMGYFLTYIGSRADAPDENYARELTQLFTVGLYELNDDGTKRLNGGKPVPSYNQQHVSDLSKVFTGWGLDDLQGDEPRYGSTGKTNFSWVSPLKFFPQYHDNNSTLNLLGSESMTTTPDGNMDIENALNILFANHNVAPFISRHLIMRLITSNPTPAYVARVASKFNNNGAGVKGDLKAVIKAILLDPEAREETAVANFGKVDEMFVASTHFLSQFKAQPAPLMSVRVRVGFKQFENRNITNMYWINPSREFGQTLLGAPSVFNFYSNEFIPSSTYFAQNTLVSPELELQNISNLIGYSNLLDTLLTVKEKYAVLDIYSILSGKERTIEEWAIAWKLSMSNQALYLDLTEEYNVFEKALDNETVANNDFASMGSGEGENNDRTRAVNALLEHLDNKLFGGTMPQAYKDALLVHTESFNYTANLKSRALRAKAIVPTIVRAIVTSPLFMVLK